MAKGALASAPPSFFILEPGLSLPQ